MSRGGRLALWIVVALWMTGTAWASLSRGVSSPPGTDVWLHGFAYGALTLLVHAALRHDGSSPHPALAAVIAWGYGAVMEGAQALVPYRTAEARDLIANGAGAAAAMIVAVVRGR